ncbi:hypothetical protein NQ317_007618 [Molorchus minor]|uniref:C2H2-type domain-containing protein n=1 Tax=Molorchus minor TaxID=1323400 RepID=A0ABQ9J1H3_9CUCU|nr:hypothetical protein NQ317_007618 [Molorchus minor]
METVECGKLVPLNAENVDSTMLEKYFPELDLTLTRDPEICPSCLQSMQQYFDYIERYVNILKDAKRDSLNEVKDYTLSDKKASASKQKTASSKSKNCRKQKHVSSLDVNNFQCAHCAYETTSRGRILRHLHRHRESDLEKRKIPKLTCDQCSFQCRSASIFKGHKRRHQTPAAKDMTKNLNPETIMYNCEICEYKK